LMELCSKWPSSDAVRFIFLSIENKLMLTSANGIAKAKRGNCKEVEKISMR